MGGIYKNCGDQFLRSSRISLQSQLDRLDDSRKYAAQALETRFESLLLADDIKPMFVMPDWRAIVHMATVTAHDRLKRDLALVVEEIEARKEAMEEAGLEVAS